MTKTLKEMTESIAVPVDPDLFLWCHGVFYAAASMSMPVENPASKPVFRDGEKAYAFTDSPMNRGMLAVMDELRERNLPQDQRMAFTWRLMHFGDVFQHEKRLEAFIKKGDAPGELEVSEALIKACATATLLTEDDRVYFDIEDIARIAQELTLKEDGGDKVV